MGSFISYYDRGTRKPLAIPDGQTRAVEHIKFSVPTPGAALHFSIDEKPDFCCYFEIKQVAGGSFEQTIRGGSNDTKIVDLPLGTFVLTVVHDINAPGGVSADYTPMVSLLPSLKPDRAGESRVGARNLGRMSPGDTIKLDENLQVYFGRAATGGNAPAPMANNRADWYRVEVTKPGLLTAFFHQTAVLEASGDTASLGLVSSDVQQFPAPFPESGVRVNPGIYYISVGVPLTGVGSSEFGIHYLLNIALML